MAFDQIDAQLPATNGVLYTVPGSTTSTIKTIYLVNTNTTTETLTLNLVRSGDTASAATIIIAPTDIVSNGNYELSLAGFFFLKAGDTIEGFSTTANVVNCFISYDEETV